MAFFYHSSITNLEAVVSKTNVYLFLPYKLKNRKLRVPTIILELNFRTFKDI